jgi:hypothetical protein
MDIISRKEAKARGLKQYFTGKPCKRGHISKRLLSTGVCLECSKISCSNFYVENKEYNRIRRNNWRKNNKEHSNKKNIEWKKNNKHKVNAVNGKRRASKIQRTPSWSNYNDVKMWYEVAEVLSRSGVKFHVDHVVPLLGKTVSGFHVENNMQVIPSYLNVSKNNQWNWEIQSHE